MSHDQQIKHQFKGNYCEIKLAIKKSNVNEKCPESGPGRHIHNIRNCDLFIEDYHILIYLDVQLYK